MTTFTDLAAIQLIAAFLAFLLSPLQAQEYADEYYGAPSGKLSGKRTLYNPSDDFETKRSLIRENQSADVLVDNGYDVEQNPSVSQGKPDYLIRKAGDPNAQWEIYDNYAPASGTSARNIWSNVKAKVDVGQTQRVVINLNDSTVSFPELQAQFSQWKITGLQDVLVVRGSAVAPLKL